MKKLLLFASLISIYSLRPAFNQQAYKLTVKQPKPLTIIITETVKAAVGEVVNLDSLFVVSGSISYYRIWQFWNGSHLQDIYDPLFTVPGNGAFYLTVTSYEDGCSATDTIALNIVTGIKDIPPDNSNRQSIHVYPNPNKGTFDIIIQDCRSGFSIEMVNSLGVRFLYKILDCNNNKYSGTITIPSGESGTYYFLVKDYNIIIYRQKVIIIK
jgi:hypothetical protein